ncbi:RNA polymerase sigma factor [Terriglobus albidus]|uniref:RNA polymerase sigma factor n=1 Tax=Terriglobus albidus TaxID=1592106 RepID=UPI0021E02ED5|nr:sigma-70 family RNA polymerase sigma factor [Terriglobus albidus]
MSSEFTAYLDDAHPIASAKGTRSHEQESTQSWLSNQLEEESATSTEESLLKDVADGSRDALATLLRRHGRAVYNVAFRILKDESEAEDLRQDLFLYIFQKASRFDPSKGTAASWIIQMAYHRAIDRRRYLQSRQHYDHQAFIEDRSAAIHGTNLGEAIDGRSLLGRLRDELTAEQVRVIELHFFEGYSLQEIAEKTGQNYGNVRNHYYRGIQRFRNHVFQGNPPAK